MRLLRVCLPGEGSGCLKNKERGFIHFLSMTHRSFRFLSASLQSAFSDQAPQCSLAPACEDLDTLKRTEIIHRATWVRIFQSCFAPQCYPRILPQHLMLGKITEDTDPSCVFQSAFTILYPGFGTSFGFSNKYDSSFLTAPHACSPLIRTRTASGAVFRIPVLQYASK